MLTKMSPTGRRLEPPGGDAAPTSALLEDTDQELELVPLTEEICGRYRQEFPDEQGRYGDAGNAWCVHDNQYLLCWAIEDVNGYLEMNQEVAWLASVLEARDVPLERLARDLEIGAAVVTEHVEAASGAQLADTLSGAATYVRSRSTFLTGDSPNSSSDESTPPPQPRRPQNIGGA
jgi:hypothetical protein